MRNKLVLMMFIFLVSAPLYAEVDPDIIMQSSFEFGEGCTVFTRFNDIVTIRSVNVSGQLMLNGQPFPQSEYDDAVFSLRDRVTGDEFEIANSHDLNYEVNVTAGSYDVLYSVETPGDTVPINKDAVVMSDVRFWQDQVMDINLTSHKLNGEFQHNGAPFPASEYDDALIFLDSATLGRVEMGNTHDQTFADVVVLAGSYETRYQMETPDTVPWNQWGFAGNNNINSDNANLVLNIQSLNVAGNFNNNDVVMPANEYDDGHFYMETSTGDRVLLGNSHDQSYDKNIITGRYDVFWELETAGDTVPFNQHARVMRNVNVATSPLNINMESVSLSGNMTRNGSAFPGVAQQTGQIVLRDHVSDREDVLSLTMEGTFDRIVVAGTYDLVYQHVKGELVPKNTNAVLYTDVAMKSDSVVNVNVLFTLYAASVYHNGVLFTDSPANQGNIFFRNDSGDSVLLGKTSQQNFSVRIIPGSYDGYYSHLTGNLVPQNQMARFAQNLSVAAPGPNALKAGIGLQVDSIQTFGSFVLNGASPPASVYDDALISLKWEEDIVPLGNTHDETYGVRMVNYPVWPYLYASYGVETPGAKMPVNGDARLHCVKLEPLVL